MARSSNTARATREAPKERASTTSRRPRSIPKTKADGEERQLEIEEETRPEDDNEDPDARGEVANDDGEATPPEPAKRRGRKPGTKAAKPAAGRSKLHQLVELAESVMAFGEEHETHPVEVLNQIEALLQATGEVSK